MNETPQDSEYLHRPDVQGHLKIMELLRKWDPIGVYYPGSDCPLDEYDGYSATIVRMLDAGVSEKELFKHLYQIKLEMDRKMLQQALRQFKQKHGRFPPDLSYLVRYGLIKEVPLDYTGKSYIYNPETGEIRAIRMLEWKKR